LEGIRGSNDIFPANQNTTYSFLDFQAPAVVKVDKGQQTLTAQLGSTNLNFNEYQEKLKGASEIFLSGAFHGGKTTFVLEYNQKQAVFQDMSGNKLNQTGAFMTCLSETALEENVKSWDCVKNIDSLKPISPPDFSLLRNGSSTPSPSSPDIAPRSNFGDSGDGEDDFGDVAADLTTTLFSPFQPEATSVLTQAASVSPMHVTHNISHAGNTFGLDMMRIGYGVGGILGVGLGVAALTCWVKKNRSSGSNLGGATVRKTAGQWVLNVYNVSTSRDNLVENASQGQGSVKSLSSHSSCETAREQQPLPGPVYDQVNEFTEKNLGDFENFCLSQQNSTNKVCVVKAQQNQGGLPQPLGRVIYDQLNFVTSNQSEQKTGQNSSKQIECTQVISSSDDNEDEDIVVKPQQGQGSKSSETPIKTLPRPPATLPRPPFLKASKDQASLLGSTESKYDKARLLKPLYAVPTNKPVTHPIVTEGEEKAQTPATPVLSSGKKVMATQSFTRRPLPKPPVSGH
jgi:hypothetical protein